MEAMLCGCPVLLLPSETFTECHTLNDYGTNARMGKRTGCQGHNRPGAVGLFPCDRRVLDAARPVRSGNANSRYVPSRLPYPISQRQLPGLGLIKLP